MKVNCMQNKKILSNFIFIVLILFLGCTPNHSKDSQNDDILLFDSLAFSDIEDEVLDSLIIEANITMPDTGLVMLYHQIAEYYENKDFDKAIFYYLKMEDLSKKLNWNKGLYLSAIGYTYTLIRQGSIDSAIVVNLQTLELAKKENNQLNIGKLLYSTANAYLMKEWFETALNYYLEALEIFERMNETERIYSTYSQLCLLYSDMGNAEKAVEFGEKSLSIFPDDPYTFMSLSKAYSIAHQHEKAIHFAEKALEISIQEDNLYLQGVTYYHLSENILMCNNDLDKAEEYAIKAIEINKELGNIPAYSGAMSILCKVEELRGNFEQAEKLTREVLQMVTELDNIQGQSFCYLLLSEIAIAQKRYDDHIEYRKKYENLEGEITSETVIRVTGEMEAKYETAKKELEIDKQKLVISNQKLQRKFFLAGLVICVALILFLWNMYLLRLRRNRALEELNNTKDRFFSIISHDLKNPAISQRDALKLLDKSVSFWDIETLKEYSSNLLKSAESQVKLLNNLLGWAQIHTGRMNFKPVSFNLSVRLRADLTLLRKMAEDKGITFIEQIPENTIVFADSNMIITVVRNLLTNAIKFTPTGGQVTLAVDILPNGKCNISVSDTGIGISKEQIHSLFRLDKMKSRKGTAGEEGSGLGLIVCREMIQKHGNTLFVESVQGNGTKFWFSI